MDTNGEREVCRSLAELIEEGKSSSDGRKAIVNSDLLDHVERLFAKACE